MPIRDRAFYEEAARAENDWVRAVVLKRDHVAHADAGEIAFKAERMALEALGPHHVSYGVAVLNIALYHLTVTNDGAKAQSALARSREILADAPLQLAEGLYWLGVSQYTNGQVTDAENAWTEALALHRRNPADAPALAQILISLSCCYIEAEPRRAAPLLAEALKLQRRALGPEHGDVRDTELRLADALRSASNRD